MQARFLNNSQIVIAAESLLEEMALKYWAHQYGSDNPHIAIETKSKYAQPNSETKDD